MSKVEHNKKLFDIEKKEDNKFIDNSGLNFKDIIKEDKSQEFKEVKETKEAKTDIPKERIITYVFKGGRKKGSLNKKTLRKLNQKEREQEQQQTTQTKSQDQTQAEPKKSDNNSNSTTTKQ